MQSVVVETLCDIIIESGMITETELDELISDNVKSQEDTIKKITNTTLHDIDTVNGIEVNDEDLLSGLYFGVIGEA
tara:strand:+ start:3264 stop:3491 length:228 start_codon:yes stop_codon:yes gene_type:complete